MIQSALLHIDRSISPVPASSNKSFPYLQVLSAKATRELQHATPTRVSLAAIYTPPKGHARLWQVQGQVHEVGHDRERREQGHCRVEKWCQSLMDKAYQGRHGDL